MQEGKKEQRDELRIATEHFQHAEIKHINAYRYEYDRPSICEGLRYRLQRPHLRECAVSSTRFSSVAAGNLAEGEIVEERNDDHGSQDHVDDVVDGREGVDAVFGGKGDDALSSAARLLYGFDALCLVYGGRVVGVVTVVVTGEGDDGMTGVDCGGVEFLMRSYTGTAAPALRVCRGGEPVLVVLL